MHPTELRSVTREQARESALTYLRKATDRAIRFTRRRCETGGMHGEYRSCCYFGTLAEGSGYPINQHIAGTVVNIRHFGRLIGAQIPDVLYDIEIYCLDVRRHDTLETHDALKLIAECCDQVLDERLELDGVRLEDIYENAGETVGV